jgi:hypothetical protein
MDYSNDNNPFDDSIRRRLEGYNEEPPQHVWEAIQQKRKQKRGGFFSLFNRRLFVLGLLLITISGGVFVYYNITKNNLNVVSKGSLVDGLIYSTIDKKQDSHNVPTANKINIGQLDTTAKATATEKKPIRILNALSNKNSIGLKSTVDNSSLKTNHAKHNITGNAGLSLLALEQKPASEINGSLADNSAFTNNQIMLANADLNYAPIINSMISNNAPELQPAKTKQIETSKTKWSSLFFFEISGGVGFAQKSIKANTDSASEHFIQLRQEAETTKPQFNFNLRICYLLKQFTFKTGFMYSQWNEKFHFDWNQHEHFFDRLDSTYYTILDPFKPPVTVVKIDSLFIDRDTLYAIDQDLNFKTYSIPFEISYQFKTGNFNYFAQLGLIYSFNTQVKGTIGVPESPYKNDVNAKNYLKKTAGLQFQLALAIDYPLNDKMSIFMQPVFSFNNKITGAENFYTQLNYSTGILLGLKIKPFIIKQKQRYVAGSPLIVRN